MTNNQFNALKRAIANHHQHIPCEGMDANGNVRPGWYIAPVCPVSNMGAKKTCPAAKDGVFKLGETPDLCDVCDTEDD